MRVVPLLTIVAAVTVIGCANEGAVQPPVESSQICGAEGAARLFCGPTRSEDLYQVPDTNWIVASALGGGIHLIDTERKSSVQIYPSPGAIDRLDATAYPTCPGPPDAAEKASFSTLGVSLRLGPADVHTLYAIRYPTVSRVHVFELDLSGEAPSVAWIGCVDAPDDDTLLNSIVPLPDGGFLATDFYSRGDAADRARALAGEATGELLRWHARTGWSTVSGSEGAGPNGVELSRDGEWVYVAEWGTREFHRMPLEGDPARRETVQLDFRPDNVHWAADDMLLLTGNTDEEPNVTKVVAVDPLTLQVTELLSRQDTELFWHASVAVQVGNEIWLGSARADGILIHPLSQSN